jgi:predicted small lipoprotein YifL
MKKLIAAFFATSIVALAACEEQGPFEEAGENVDDAIEDAQDAVEDPGE